jgi:hypothetical protein
LWNNKKCFVTVDARYKHGDYPEVSFVHEYNQWSVKFEGQQFLPKNSKEGYLTICFIFHNYFIRQYWLRYDAPLTSKVKHDFNHRTKLAGKGRAQGFLRRNTKLSVKNPEINIAKYRGADKSLARPTSRYILFDGESISFDPRLVI